MPTKSKVFQCLSFARWAAWRAHRNPYDDGFWQRQADFWRRQAAFWRRELTRETVH